jgi:hypothetical protein
MEKTAAQREAVDPSTRGTVTPGQRDLEENPQRGMPGDGDA